jgi:hypothetical protein
MNAMDDPIYSLMHTNMMKHLTDAILECLTMTTTII